MPLIGIFLGDPAIAMDIGENSPPPAGIANDACWRRPANFLEVI